MGFKRRMGVRRTCGKLLGPLVDGTYIKSKTNSKPARNLRRQLAEVLRTNGNGADHRELDYPDYVPDVEVVYQFLLGRPSHAPTGFQGQGEPPPPP